MIVCIGFADLGIDQLCALVDESPDGAFDYDSIIHRIPKRGCEEKVRKNSPGLHSLFFMSGSKSKTGKRE